MTARSFLATWAPSSTVWAALGRRDLVGIYLYGSLVTATSVLGAQRHRRGGDTRSRAGCGRGARAQPDACRAWPPRRPDSCTSACRRAARVRSDRLCAYRAGSGPDDVVADEGHDPGELTRPVLALHRPWPPPGLVAGSGHRHPGGRGGGNAQLLDPVRSASGCAGCKTTPLTTPVVPPRAAAVLAHGDPHHERRGHRPPQRFRCAKAAGGGDPQPPGWPARSRSRPASGCGGRTGPGGSCGAAARELGLPGPDQGSPAQPSGRDRRTAQSEPWPRRISVLAPPA